MKTKILMLAWLFISAIASAETMRVAILEPVDRENKVSYGTKLILRSNLSKAVTNTAGYEAYDRSDMDAIMGEQNFQRTGMVSEDQIKRLGEMTGAKYILVAEAAVIGTDNMFITAKVLDVETARTIMTDNLMMGMDATQIQEGCATLAMRLFTANESNSPAKKVSNKTPEKAETKDKVMLVHNSKTVRKYMHKKEFSYGTLEMNEKELFAFLSEKCPDAYIKIIKAKKLKDAGWGVLGATCLGAMFVYIPCLNKGYKDYEKAIDYFNQTCPNNE